MIFDEENSEEEELKRIKMFQKALIEKDSREIFEREEKERQRKQQLELEEKQKQYHIEMQKKLEIDKKQQQINQHQMNYHQMNHHMLKKYQIEMKKQGDLYNLLNKHQNNQQNNQNNIQSNQQNNQNNIQSNQQNKKINNRLINIENRERELKELTERKQSELDRQRKIENFLKTDMDNYLLELNQNDNEKDNKKINKKDDKKDTKTENTKQDIKDENNKDEDIKDDNTDLKTKDEKIKENSIESEDIAIESIDYYKRIDDIDFIRSEHMKLMADPYLYNSTYFDKLKVIHRFTENDHRNSVEVNLLERFVVSKRCNNNFSGYSMFWNEVNALSRLKALPHFPILLGFNYKKLTIYMTYCGPTISYNNLPNNWEYQVEEIKAILKKVNINSNDILLRNICCLGDEIKIIDFGLYSYFDGSIEDSIKKLYSELSGLSKIKNKYNTTHDNQITYNNYTNYTNYTPYFKYYNNWRVVLGIK
jgi:hypothetical protein